MVEFPEMSRRRWFVSMAGGTSQLLLAQAALGQTPADPAGIVAAVHDDGDWQWRDGDYRAQIAADPLHGLFRPKSGVSTASGCWVRRWDGLNGQPEWFGAVGNDPAIDCAAAIRACYRLCPVTLLKPVHYHIGSKLVFDIGHRAVLGASSFGEDGGGSWLVATFDDDDAVHYGPVTSPPDAGSFINEIDLANFTIGRTLPRRPPGAGDQRKAHAGLNGAHVLRAFLRNISVRDFSIGFRLSKLVYVKIRDCAAFVHESATNPADDVFRGFWLDSAAPVFSYFPGGNASLFLDGCSVINETSIAMRDPIGLYISGLFCDTYVTDFETANIAKGVVVIGQDLDGPVTSPSTANGNLHLSKLVLDQCAPWGIELGHVGLGGAVELIDPYVMLSNADSTGILIHNCHGEITLTGGQIVGTYSRTVGSSMTRAIHATGSGGVSISGTKLINMSRPVELLNCDGFDLSLAIHNPHFASDPKGPAISLTNCHHCRLTPRIRGMAGAFTRGVDLAGSTNLSINVDPTMIDGAATPGGKVAINAMPVTAPGYYPAAGTGAGPRTIGITGPIQ